MTALLDACGDAPTRTFAEGEILIAEGDEGRVVHVLRSGRVEVTRSGAPVAVVAEAGAVLGEISAFLDSPTSATVTATETTVVHVVEDPVAFFADHPDAMVELVRILAARLQSMVAYLADVKAQYEGAGGHLGLVDEVLGRLTFGERESVEMGSEREPDPPY